MANTLSLLIQENLHSLQRGFYLRGHSTEARTGAN